jgi:hypothetical protein
MAINEQPQMFTDLVQGRDLVPQLELGHFHRASVLATALNTPPYLHR